MNLTEAQTQAVTVLDKDLCVSAGAGSGKTTILVERFFQLVAERKASPEHIVAITYTEKAANHMKERLVRLFADRGLVEERRALENSYIGTIHSFAARLLRENPVEAGVAPDFSVLEAGTADVLMDEALEQVMEECAGEVGGLALLARYGEEEIRESLKKLHQKLASLGKNLEEVLAPVKRPRPEDLWENLRRRLGTFLAGESGSRPAKTYRENYDSARLLVRLLSGKTDFQSAAPLADLEAAVRGFRKAPDHGEDVEEIRALFQDALSLSLEMASLPYFESYRAFYERFRARYGDLKQRGSYLDFDDLLIRAFRLFAGEDEVARALGERYRAKFAYILVDEFQDTGRLQAELIDCLRSPGNLFIVGDAKQSIYRFRNADLEAFFERAKAIAESPCGLPVALHENYRSRAQILDFINLFFEKVWAEDTFRFEPLIPKRDFPVKELPSVELLVIEQGLRAEHGEERESKDEARIREARTLARRLKEIVEERLVTLTGRDGSARPAAYGDIAILFRAMTHVSLYEKELRDLDIPYFVVRGRGFYEKQEVADLVDFLKILEDPTDDIALAGVLRSPLVGLSEDALFWLACVKEERGETVPLFEGLTGSGKLGKLRPEDRQKLAPFLDLYSRLQCRKDKYKISEILVTLRDETLYDRVLLGKPDGGRKFANVRKLVDSARDFEKRADFGLKDFIHYVEHLSLEEARESEAQVELEAGDSVKLLTIHKAKGLEFPVVAVADLGGEPQVRESLPFNFSERYGVGWRVRHEAARKVEEGYTYRKNREWEESKQAEEYKRLLYVALTRAEEHLILTGVSALGSQPAKPYREIAAWIEWFRKALMREGNGDSPTFDFEGVAVTRLGEAVLRKHWKRATSIAERSPFKELLPLFEPLSVDGRGAEAAREFVHASVRVRKDYFETRDVPVTGLLKYRECPGCYHQIYVMRASDEEGDLNTGREDGGRPDESLPGRPAGAGTYGGEALEGFEEEGDLPRREFGNLFHRAMQHFDFGAPFEQELARQLKELGPLAGPSESQEMESAIRAFFNSEWGRKAARARTFRELAFVYRLPRGTLRGQIDLIVENGKAGEISLVDYKTNLLHGGRPVPAGSASSEPGRGEEDLQEKVKSYEFQIRLYALALWELTGRRPANGALYFTSAGRAVAIELSEKSLMEAKAEASRCLEEIVLAQEPFPHAAGCRGSEIRPPAWAYEAHE